MKDKLTEEMNEVKDDFEEYVNARLDLAKLHAAENLSRFMSGMILKIGLFYLLFFVLFFASIAVAFWLNTLFESQGTGFIIIAGFYMLLALMFFAMRKTLIHKPVIQSFIQLFFPKYTDYDESK
ncbi:phage holin family protein [Carboxylicivirga sp. A043]|uniref:phage holin family protein n=1 Tax=Carboxylicivirga litoralis TaxID=2816963 RepID=UPI0021CB0B73|nr:phage holin family protein [Carboxylicivirga sp. A043]MCU4158114.1 phage holin family protein [Carboxylicivirga sp. A043]